MSAGPAVKVDFNVNPITPSANLSFKSLTIIQLGADDDKNEDNSTAFVCSTQGIACSNKHGCILTAVKNSFLLMNANDIWQAEVRANATNAKKVSLSQVPHVKIENNALGSNPTIIAFSNGEEYLAVNTNKNGSVFVTVFKFDDFIIQRGQSKPFCEIRVSDKEDVKVSSVCWNPGDNLSNVLAVSCSDGSLTLAKVVGENALEKWVIKEGIQTICWSPKGKQLVAGKSDGSLSQLKLDLTEAKKIPGPGGRLPTSIFWNSTSQFVVLFDSSSEMSIMVVDVVKGGPVQYSNFGDAFMSDSVPYTRCCFFLPLSDWKCMVSTSNSSNEILLLGKKLENDPWSILDIHDHKRAALPVDSYALGAATYLAHGHDVVLSDTEKYSPMPILFVLSQNGCLHSFFVLNSDTGASNIMARVTEPIPESLFSASMAISVKSPIPVNTQTPKPFTPLSMNVSPLQSALLQTPVPPHQLTTLGILPAPHLQQTPVPQNQKVSPRPVSSLPTTQNLEQVKSILSERLLETNTLSDEAQEYQNLLIDVQKFEQRLTNFKQMQTTELVKMETKLEESYKYLENTVLRDLKIMENFVKDIEENSKCQNEEVDVLKEKMLYRFSHLEYAKSLAEQSKDLKYMQLMRSRPLDPTTQAKFQKIEKLHNYIKNQITEAQRFFYYNKCESGSSSKKEPTSAQYIYQTLANHSQIIRSYSQEVEQMRVLMRLRKNAISDGSFELMKQPPESSVTEDNDFRQDFSKEFSCSELIPKNSNSDVVSLEELISGIGSVTLDKDSDDITSKPLMISEDKLRALTNLCSQTEEIALDLDFSPVFDLGNVDNFDSISGGQKTVRPTFSTSLKSTNQKSVSFNLSQTDSSQMESSNFSASTLSSTEFLSRDSTKSTNQSLPKFSKEALFSMPKEAKPFNTSDTGFLMTASVDPSKATLNFPAFTSATGPSTAPSVTPLNSNLSLTELLGKSSSSTTTSSSLSFNQQFSFNPAASISTMLSSHQTTSPPQTNPTSIFLKPSPVGPATISDSKPLSIFGEPPLTITTQSIFGGAGGLFGQNKSPSSALPISSSPSIIVGGTPPSATVKSIGLPVNTFKPPSSSSSSTSEESGGEQRQFMTSSASPFTILSTPKPTPAVGLWGISTGQAPGSSIAATFKPPVSTVHPLPTIPFTSITSPKDMSNIPPLVPLQMKSAGPSSTILVATPTTLTSSMQTVPPTLKIEDDKTVTSSKDSISSILSSTSPATFHGVTVTPIKVQSNETIATSFGGEKATSNPSTLFSNTLGTATTVSIFGSPISSSKTLSENTASTGIFTSSTPTPSSTATPSLFGGSLQNPPVTSTTTSFSTAGLFSGVPANKSIFGGGITDTAATATPTTSTTILTSSAPPQATSFADAAATVLTSTDAPAATTTTTTTTASLFSTPTTAAGVFGGSGFGVGSPPTAVSTTPSVFGSSSGSIFGGSAFGGVTATTTAAAPASPFGGSTSPPVQSPFGNTPTSSTTAQSPFGNAPTSSTTAQSPFGNTPNVSVASSPFAPASNTGGTSLFGGGVGNVSSSPFGGGIATATSPFGGASTISASTPASPFGATSTASTTSSSIFGQSQSTSIFGGSPSGFGAPSSFGATPVQPSANSVFGQSSSASVFGGKPAFGSPTPFASGSSFGSISTQQPSASSVFGTSSFGGGSTAQPESIFGNSSFSGLGAKPSTDGVNRNIFGGNTTYGAGASSGIFGSSGANTLGSSSAAAGGGAFSGGGAAVVQTGFGASPTKPSVGAFGSSPTFGSAPAFGSSPFGPAFGQSAGSPTTTFGAGGGGTGSIFGGANQNTGPTFGALAQTSPPAPSFGGGFSSPTSGQNFGQQQQQQQSPSFGGGSSFSSWR